MPAGGMAGQKKRAFDHRGGALDGRGNFARDLGDAHSRAQRVGGHRHRIAAFNRSAREMRPKALVERLPESAMDEDDQALWPAFRSEEIEAVSCALAIWNVERRAATAVKCVAIGLRGLHPRGRQAFAARNV